MDLVSPSNDFAPLGGTRILTHQSDRDLPPCAVIVTIADGQCYDNLFRQNPQVSPDPSQTVALFQLNYSSFDDLLHGLLGQVIDSQNAALIQEICECISQVEHESVVFNFECCSQCHASGFRSPSAIHLIKTIISHQHIAIFGDFSLKALVHDWDESLLGPLPFVITGDTDIPMILQFDPEVLINCCNTQLQNVGKMCGNGEAVVGVMSGTIVFDILSENTDNDMYTTEVLTRCSNSLGKESSGHAMLTYPTGGKMIVSAGHWIELSHLSGATEDSVLKLCSEQMGVQRAEQFKFELDRSATLSERTRVIQESAKEIVWSSAPCKYSPSPALSAARQR
jgi:hypothetical protein